MRKYFCLCAIASTCAFAQNTYQCPPGQTVTVICPGAPVTLKCDPPNMIVSGVCIAPPQPTSCSGAANLPWPKLETVSLFPNPPLGGSGPDGASIQFTADAAEFPTGFIFRVSDESPIALGKEVVISTCPHSFTPVNNQAACRAIGPANPQIVTRFLPPAGDCNLQAGGVYYFNFRPDTPGNEGTTFVQIAGAVRSTCWGIFCQ